MLLSQFEERYRCSNQNTNIDQEHIQQGIAWSEDINIGNGAEEIGERNRIKARKHERTKSPNRREADEKRELAWPGRDR